MIYSVTPAPAGVHAFGGSGTIFLSLARGFPEEKYTVPGIPGKRCMHQSGIRI